MNTEWFILKKNEHLGPFSKKEILEMVDAKKLKNTVQIWREGWTHAKLLDDAFRDEINYADSDIPPPLPPLFPTIKKQIIGEKKIISKKIANPTKIRMGIAITIVSIFFVLLYSISFKLFSPKIFNRPALMAISAHERLMDSAQTAGELKAKASLSNDKKVLWIALNTSLSGKVFIRLKSLADQTLDGHSHIEASANLTNKLIELTQFQFISGTRLVEGYYHIDIKSVGEMELPFWSRFFGDRINTLQFSGKILISGQSQKNFEKQLAKILDRKKSNSQQFWDELIQKYQTVMMISDQIKDGFLKVFNSPINDWNKETQNFEMEYAAKYGVFFTEFVKANEASYQKIYSKKFENVNDVLANYNQLSNIATEIGEHSMLILENLQNFKGDELDANELTKKSLEKLESIKNRCKDKLQSLTETLK